MVLCSLLNISQAMNTSVTLKSYQGCTGWTAAHQHTSQSLLPEQHNLTP
jgi:hypothetical protein